MVLDLKSFHTLIILKMKSETSHQSEGIGEQFGGQKLTSKGKKFSMQVICNSNRPLKQMTNEII